MSSENKICPHCGSDMFMATITRGGLVKVITTEDGNDEMQIMKEMTDKAEIHVIKCAKCKEAITENDLITGIKCKTCGAEVNPDEVENGNCGPCAIISENPELENASVTDILRLLAKEKQRTSYLTKHIAQKEAEAEKAESKITETEEPVEEPTEEVQEKDPDASKKRKKRKVKNVDKSETEDAVEDPVVEDVAEESEPEELTEQEEESVESEVTTEEVQAEVDNIANQQEAPFPDIPPEEIVTEETTTEEPEEESPFEMFDNSDDII